MEDEDQTAKQLERALHALAQQLQVISMAIAAIERRDGARHAKVLEPAKRALESLDRGLEELVELARRGRRSPG
jgi:bisphosphoglycerate-independent phosphoglycerate mutase (AlkP superfamily)